MLSVAQVRTQVHYNTHLIFKSNQINLFSIKHNTMFIAYKQNKHENITYRHIYNIIYASHDFCPNGKVRNNWRIDSSLGCT